MVRLFYFKIIKRLKKKKHQCESVCEMLLLLKVITFHLLFACQSKGSGGVPCQIFDIIAMWI